MDNDRGYTEKSTDSAGTKKLPDYSMLHPISLPIGKMAYFLISRKSHWSYPWNDC